MSLIISLTHRLHQNQPGWVLHQLKVGSGDGSSRRFIVYTRDMSLLLF